MKRLAVPALALMLFHVAAAAESYSGPGPDPGGDGSALTIQFDKGQPVFFENATFNSDKTYATRLRADGKGGWNVVILVYSANGADRNPPVEDKLLKIYKFAATDAEAGDKAMKALDHEKVDWVAEPARLLKFYTAGKADFEKNDAGFDPSKNEDK